MNYLGYIEVIIYDKTALAFIQKSEKMVRSILIDAGYDVRRQRFLVNKSLYPIHVVVFEGPLLGYFDASFWQIGLNRKLIWSAKEDVLRDIIKHELAHYLTFIEFGITSAHGAEFRRVCSRLGFSPEIASATTDIELSNENKYGDLESERVIEKVKKLLHLAQSTDAHEAELATLRANEILLRYNLNLITQNSLEKDEPIYMNRVLEQPRRNAKLESIYEILRHFIVRPVLSHAKGKCVLEVSGSLTNVKLATYIAGFLDKELDSLWLSAQKQNNLTGLRAKNSFFAGIAKGFDEKMKLSKQNLAPVERAGLIKIESQLNIDMKSIYRRLSYTSSNSRTDEVAEAAGHARGKTLNIRTAVESSKVIRALLPFKN